MPHNEDAERSVLGALLLHPDAVADVDFLASDDFYSVRHQLIFEVIKHVVDRKSIADPITVGEELDRRNSLAEAGGQDYLVDLMEGVVSAAAVAYHADLVREKAVQRKLLETCLDISRQAYENESEAKELLDQAEARIFEIARFDKTGEPVAIADILQETFEKIDNLRERQDRITGVATNYYEFDDYTGGLHGGELSILAARPSMGKTTLALNLVERVAAQGFGVAFFSLEMSKQQVIQNMLCCRAQVNGQDIRTGRVTEEQYRRLQEEAESLYEAEMFVDDTPGITVNAMRAKVRRLASKYDIKLVVVDYLQLMSGGGRYEGRQQEISAISRGLKAIAREMDVPVIALSQLNRDVENRDDHRPRMSDLRESGAIEQDADVILLLHRDDYFNPTEENRGLAQLILAKQRNGPTGEITLRFFRNYMRFENYERRSEPMG